MVKANKLIRSNLNWMEVVTSSDMSLARKQKIIYHSLRASLDQNRSLLVPTYGGAGFLRWNMFIQNLSILPAKARQLLRLTFGDLNSIQVIHWGYVENFFDANGFCALPVDGAIQPRWYFLLLSLRIYPVSFRWLKWHPQICVDTLHELGHGSALCLPEYRRNIVEFSRRAAIFMTKEPSHKEILKIRKQFHDCFEFSCVFNEGEFLPIGSVLLTSELLRSKLDQPENLLQKILPSHLKFVRCFKSVKHWDLFTKNLINSYPIKTYEY